MKRVLLGLAPDGSVGIRISKPAYDVTTNPVDPTQLIFDSGWASALPVYYRSGVVSVASGAALTLSFAAALSYVPFLAWMESDDGSNFYQGAFLGYNGSGKTGTYGWATEPALTVGSFADHIQIWNTTNVAKYLFVLAFRQVAS